MEESGGWRSQGDGGVKGMEESRDGGVKGMEESRGYRSQGMDESRESRRMKDCKEQKKHLQEQSNHWVVRRMVLLVIVSAI